MRLLGIDYGLRKIGLALADNGLAEPLSVISNRLSVISKISGICQKHGVEKIVIGMPEGEIVVKVKKFAEKLSQVTNLPIAFQDETLTSKEAVVKMIEAGKKRKYRQTKSDAFAAAIILQEFIDSHV